MRRCQYLLAAAASADLDVSTTYDAVVVGGGTAGCLIAGRLAMENLKTLVLEEGCDIRKQPDWHATLPASVLAHRVAKRGYEHTDRMTTPQVHPDGGEKRAVCIPSPKVLGGRGVMGSCVWGMGDARDWEGTPHHFREELLPRLRGLENMEVFVPHRGKRGRFLISRPMNFSPFFKAFSEAASQDVPLLTEITKPTFKLTEGIGRLDLFVDQSTGKAHTTLHRYLLDSLRLQRPLTVKCEAKVVGIRPGEQRTVASGVTYREPNGQLVDVKASLIIIAAGAIGSPTLLGASRGSITVDSAVGTQFWDKPQVVLQYRGKQPHSHNCLMNPLVRGYLWTDLQRGRTINSLRSSWDDLMMLWSSTGRHDHPDVEILLQPFTLGNDGCNPLPEEHGCQLTVRLLRPKSRGAVLADGSIDPRYLTNSADLAAMQKALTYVRENFVKKMPLVPVIGSSVGELYESSGIHGGSCSAIIDPQSFQLKGMANVYVCDDSVLPAVSGSTLPYTIVMADKFVDKLLRKNDVRRKTQEQTDGGATRIIY